MYREKDVIRFKVNNNYNGDPKQLWRVCKVYDDHCIVIHYHKYNDGDYDHNESSPLEMRHYHEFELIEKYKHDRKEFTFTDTMGRQDLNPN